MADLDRLSTEWLLELTAAMQALEAIVGTVARGAEELSTLLDDELGEKSRQDPKS